MLGYVIIHINLRVSSFCKLRRMREPLALPLANTSFRPSNFPDYRARGESRRYDKADRYKGRYRCAEIIGDSFPSTITFALSNARDVWWTVISSLSPWQQKDMTCHDIIHGRVLSLSVIVFAILLMEYPRYRHLPIWWGSIIS